LAAIVAENNRRALTMTPEKSARGKKAYAMGLASAGVFVGLAGLAAIEVFTIATRLEASAFDPAFCSPSSLHTTVEPPETQLTRDYAAIRILLKDPRSGLEQIRRVYAGDFHASSAARSPSPLLKSSGRAQLFKADYQRNPWTGSLRKEAQRIDRERGTTLAMTIDTGLQAGDRVAVEAAFRGVFAVLLDDLLASIQQRLDQSATVGRALQHARRYYSESFDAYLSINAAPQATRASFALDAMARAIDDIKAGKSAARDWFARERVNFMRAVHEGMGVRVGQQALRKLDLDRG
jgi:hypothetical protein